MVAATGRPGAVRWHCRVLALRDRSAARSRAIGHYGGCVDRAEERVSLVALGTRILGALMGTWFLATGVIRLWLGFRDSSRTEAQVGQDQPRGSRLALVCWGLGGIALGIGFLAAVA